MVFGNRFRSVALGLAMATLGVGCQSVFGDFHVDDNAFASAGTNNGNGGDGNGDGDGGTGNGSGNGTGNGGKKGTVDGSAGRSGAEGGAGSDPDGPPGPFLITPTRGLYTTEWGTQAAFSVVLTQLPTATVTIGLSSNDTNEGRISVDSLVFTVDDWNAPQIVVVSGFDDSLPDGNQTYKIVTAPAKSDDKAFDGEDPQDVTLTNIDDETAGITVSPTAGLVTSESGAFDTFTVVLNSKPKKDVTVDLSSSKPSEGTIEPTSLVFTDTNWMAPQLVTVTGQDDDLKDKAQSYKIVTAPSKSADPTYDGVDADDVDVVNQDNESAGVTVSLISGMDPIEPTKLRTSENGDSATFSVELNAPPSSDVIIPLSSSATGEGTVSPPSLTFTKDNWNAPQIVTVTGVEDDDTADGNQPYSIQLEPAESEDGDYKRLNAADVPAINVDNDKPGFTVMLVSGIDNKDPSRLFTTEAGTTATFSIALNSKPKATVSVNLSSTETAEGTVTPLVVTFTKENYKAPQLVTVKGVNDSVQDGDQVYYVRTAKASSDDAGYQLDPPDVQLINQDNDIAGVIISLASGIDPTNWNKLATGENGDTATFTVALRSQPTADVTISLASGNTAEGTVSPTTLKFTKANYNSAQIVTVKGVDDQTVDGNQPYTIGVNNATSQDPNFNQKFGTQVQVTNRDNDTAGIIVAPISGLITSEDGLRKATFTIVLQSKPTKDVSIALSSSAPKEGIPNVSSVKFTAANWNAPQTITVSGQQDDGVADGDAAYKIITDPPQSQDPNYGPTKMNPSDVSLTNLDDDSPGIIVFPQTGLSTTEDGTTATFTVVLQSKPVASVKINLSSSRPTEGKVSPASLTFTDVNWRSAQVVTVTGVNDDSFDGPQAYLVQFAGASSTDPKYNGRVAHDVSVTNVDNDTANVRITPTPTETSTPTAEKGGSSSTFTVRLTSLPTAPVTYTLTSTNTSEGTVSPSMLSFTAANWSVPQTVKVSGVDDSVADGDQPYKIQLSNGTSTDANYNGKFGTALPFINVDDDHPGYVVNAASDLKTNESGTSVTFTVKLLSQPTDTVTIPLVSSDAAEGAVTPASLMFTTLNWDAVQTVKVTGVNDTPPVADGPQSYSVQLGAALSTDLNYKGLYATSVSLTNLDDDVPGITVTPASGLQTSEDGGKATFTVVLLSSPTGTNTVSIGLSSSKVNEGTVSPAKLVFTGGATGNWNIPQTVTVTGVDDDVPVADGDVGYSIQFAPAVSGDAAYSGKVAGPVALTNTDNDTASVVVTSLSCKTTPGTDAVFTVKLTSQPSGPVTIPVSSDNPDEGTIAPASIVFTVDDWNIAQTVTVSGVDDMTTGKATGYMIITGPATSSTDTTGYKGYDPEDVSCVNTTP